MFHENLFTKLSERVDCISDILPVVMAVSEIFNNPTWFKLASARHKEFTLCGLVAYVTEFHFQAHFHICRREDQSNFTRSFALAAFNITLRLQPSSLELPSFDDLFSYCITILHKPKASSNTAAPIRFENCFFSAFIALLKLVC